ncbi:MAG: hypothetical protein VB010_12385 [Sphaerochaeta associata]|uniref:hypothetical protein n=1 Tax=Sphaerochaeta associata TaxID=1129264 RepID=UPI002B21F748|nr:hypothetical protein [Sphaerochaeta associata]MEA5108131.1 hypothetical protein [Sphaerochaeta associata]
MHNHRRLAVLLLVFATTVPLMALPLQDLIAQALSKSTSMQDLEYSKQKALLTVGLNQVKKELGIEVSSGEVIAVYDDSSNSYTFDATGVSAAFTLPNDGKTMIKVSTGSIGLDAPFSDYVISPVVSASHTLTYGYTADNRKDLLNRQTEVLALSTYESSKLNFTTSIYTQIDSLLENGKSIKQTEKDLADLKKTLEQNLALKLIRQESLTYQAQMQAIRTRLFLRISDYDTLCHT